MIVQGLEFDKTCSACPEQYDVYKDGKQVAYLRLRHGTFTVRCPDVGGKIVYTSCPEGDGLFEDHERDEFLDAAATEINEWLKCQPTT